MGSWASSSAVSDVASLPAASASVPVAEVAASAIGSACGSSEDILDWGRSEGERQVGDVGVTYALSTHADVHDVIALVSIFGITSTAGLLFDFFAFLFIFVEVKVEVEGGCFYSSVLEIQHSSYFIPSYTGRVTILCSVEHCYDLFVHESAVSGSDSDNGGIGFIIKVGVRWPFQGGGLCWREFLVLTAASLSTSTMGARASGVATVVAVSGCVDNTGIVAPLTRFAVGDTSLATLEQCARSSAGMKSGV